jgi:hypothetical protein
MPVRLHAVDMTHASIFLYLFQSEILERFVNLHDGVIWVSQFFDIVSLNFVLQCHSGFQLSNFNTWNPGLWELGTRVES